MTFLYNPSIFSALNGGFSVTISYKTQPSDHISDLLSYAFSFHTSGLLF